MATPRGRLLPNNQLVYDQADFFQDDGFTRVPGLTLSQVALVVFFQNIVQPWPLVNGTTVTDPQIASGYVYFNEVASAPGFYSLRWWPNATGYWRLILTYPGGTQTSSQDYDIVPASVVGGSGLSASFIKRDC